MLNRASTPQFFLVFNCLHPIATSSSKISNVPFGFGENCFNGSAKINLIFNQGKRSCPSASAANHLVLDSLTPSH